MLAKNQARRHPASLPSIITFNEWWHTGIILHQVPSLLPMPVSAPHELHELSPLVHAIQLDIRLNCAPNEDVLEVSGLTLNCVKNSLTFVLGHCLDALKHAILRRSQHVRQYF